MRTTLVWLFFLLYAVAVTYPGVAPFNRVFPLVGGLPFVLAWYAFWVVLAGLALFLYDATSGGD